MRFSPEIDTTIEGFDNTFSDCLIETLSANKKIYNNVACNISPFLGYSRPEFIKNHKPGQLLVGFSEGKSIIYSSSIYPDFLAVLRGICLYSYVPYTFTSTLRDCVNSFSIVNNASVVPFGAVRTGVSYYKNHFENKDEEINEMLFKKRTELTHLYPLFDKLEHWLGVLNAAGVPVDISQIVSAYRSGKIDVGEKMRKCLHEQLVLSRSINPITRK